MDTRMTRRAFLQKSSLVISVTAVSTPLALTIAPGCPPDKPDQDIVKNSFLQAALPGIQDMQARLEIPAG